MNEMAIEPNGRVLSADGTPIAYERQGRGPALILIGGAFDDGSENKGLARELSESFTVYNYSRRGRGQSGDTLPYELKHEIEDIEALIAEAGGQAHLYGLSSGGALALEAAASGLAIGKLAVYEVPYSLGEEALARWAQYRNDLGRLLSGGRRGEAVELFMRLAGAPPESIGQARKSPMWAGLEAMAHTLAYDAACMGEGKLPVSRLQLIKQPVLVITGSTIDPAMGNVQASFFQEAADALRAAVPRAGKHVLEGQSHRVDPKAIAPVLARFFAA